MSGLFKGSQMNWACLTKEAYAIYMSIKKLAYYLEDADITLRSDHLPLKKFLAKNTLNSKVNNWAIEISPFRITFEYIKGIKNTLADTMNCPNKYRSPNTSRTSTQKDMSLVIILLIHYLHWKYLIFKLLQQHSHKMIKIMRLYVSYPLIKIC